MRYIYSFSVIALAFLAGCKNEPPAPPEPEPPPPLTATKIHSDYKAALQPLFNAATPGVPFGVDQKTPILTQFDTIRRQMAQEINEPEGKDKIEKDVRDNVKKAERAEQWFVVDALLDVHKRLRPESQVYTSLRRRSDLMMARPIVESTGFITIGDEPLTSFLSITDPKTRKVDTYKVKEGEEFYPNAEGKSVLRLVKVIGAQSAIEMEYLALPGETWVVPGPKND